MSNVHQFQSRRDPVAPRPPVTISPRFIPVLAAFLAAGVALYTGIASGGVPVFVFVMAGWVVALCLHEFGHAYVAYRGGDTGVRERGYLSLDPLGYSHPMFSIVLPVLFLAIGGIGLPGGAVYIDRDKLKTRRWDSLVSIAGPAMTFACFLALAAPFFFEVYRGAEPDKIAGTLDFWAGLAMLAYILAMAVVFNLLPLPGFDGFGALAVFMSRETERKLMQYAQPVMLLFILAVVVYPAALRPLNVAAGYMNQLLGVPLGLVGHGLSLFRFWS
jgi:Zn-dependent protease